MSYDGHELASNAFVATNPMAGEIRIVVDASAYEATPGVKVRGTLVNVPPEFAAKEFYVRLLSRSGFSPVETWVMKDGSFEFSKIFPGTYEASLLRATPSTVNDQPISAPISEIVVGSEGTRGLTLDLKDNPFPENPRGSRAAIFDNRTVAFEGVITQAVARLEPRLPRYFFRMDVRDAATGAVRQWAVTLNHLKGMPAGDPDLARLRVGTRISIVANLDRDGSPRAYVVPQDVPGSIAGIVVREP